MDNVKFGGTSRMFSWTARPGLGPVDSLSCLVIMTSPTQLFKDVARFLTPTAPVLDSEYDGLEYSWKIFVFRPARE